MNTNSGPHYRDKAWCSEHGFNYKPRCPVCEEAQAMKNGNTFSKDWCQGFCRSCGTACAEYCETIHRMRTALERIGGHAGDVDPLRGCQTIIQVVREALK